MFLLFFRFISSMNGRENPAKEKKKESSLQHGTQWSCEGESRFRHIAMSTLSMRDLHRTVYASLLLPLLISICLYCLDVVALLFAERVSISRMVM
ncbi:hypothetical protein BDV29DRAFT_121373 [Aspergillus leporis]|uniref:Uncharacterized protein n=1 Tax=Aspergillus leporis TaxID=41062 RepID=A0A5N5XFT4_9EURO|nr:hypothetical protein BDV29DRAFT_121373 [Aspergillus leporis]